MSEDLTVFDPLISRLHQATSLGDDARIAAAVKAEIEAFIAGKSPDDLRLPERFYQKDPCGKYGRRALVAEDHLNVLIMAWHNDTPTPLHDHDKTWCVEGVLEGQIAVTRFELLDRTPADIKPGDSVRFARREHRVTGRGQATALHGTDQYHILANPNAGEIALTLHVYGRELMRCTIFRPEGGDVYRAEPTSLHLTEDAPTPELTIAQA